LDPDVQAGDQVYSAIQLLSPRDDTQRTLKAQAATLTVELGEIRSLLLVQSAESISRPLLVVVIFWLAVIFLCYSLLAPPNATAIAAMTVSVLSVSLAIFLILDLDQAFGGLMRISCPPILNALTR
jgi:membrane-bound ClpP family serine protease